MDFENMYGELGKGFIHVHHIVPISMIGKEYKIDPIKDLVPVCPNCHAMLHRCKDGNVYTIDGLKEMIALNKLNNRKFVVHPSLILLTKLDEPPLIGRF